MSRGGVHFGWVDEGKENESRVLKRMTPHHLANNIELPDVIKESPEEFRNLLDDLNMPHVEDAHVKDIINSDYYDAIVFCFSIVKVEVFFVNLNFPIKNGSTAFERFLIPKF